MRKTILLLVTVCFLAVANHGQTKDTGVESARNTFCRIYEEPETIAGKTLKLKAIYVQSLNMPALLWGAKCKNRYVIASYDKANQQDYLDIVAGLRPQDVDRLDQSYVITFLGVLTKNKTEGHTPIKGVLQNYTLVIQKLYSVSRHEKK